MIKQLTLIVFLISSGNAFAETSWFRGGTTAPFLKQSLIIETDSWATCAAVLNVVADRLRAQGKDNLGKFYGNAANGAELSIAIAHVLNFLQNAGIDQNGDIPPEYAKGLARAWNVGKMAMEGLPDAKRTLIMAELEVSDNPDKWLEKVMDAFNVCLANVDTQHMYVDVWREMVSSGTLVVPETQ
jgi:hypothetical protein